MTSELTISLIISELQFFLSSFLKTIFGGYIIKQISNINCIISL